MSLNALRALMLCSVAGPVSAIADVCDRATSDVFDAVSPSVVRVFSVAIDPFSLSERVNIAVGTGLVVDAEAHIVTNAHLVFESKELMISVDDEELLPASVVGIDPITDIAVIQPQFEIVPPAPPAAFGSSGDLIVGEEVLAIGFPFGIGKTASRGIVSALQRVVPITPFSWRAPFIDSCGLVVGINTLSSELGQNLSFAVPIDLVIEISGELIEQGRVIRAWHGINGRILPFPLAMAFGMPFGFLVETVEPGSPADQIGLSGGTFPAMLGAEEYVLGGAVIVSVNGEDLMDMESVNQIAASLEVGDTVELTYIRDGEFQTSEVVLPERPLLPGDVRRFRERRSRSLR
jgi:S1-C subfamily serine protease